MNPEPISVRPWMPGTVAVEYVGRNSEKLLVLIPSHLVSSDGISQLADAERNGAIRHASDVLKAFLSLPEAQQDHGIQARHTNGDHPGEDVRK